MADTTGNPRARALAAALRRARISAGYGVREVARTLNMSHTTISQWETGKRVPALADLTAMLTAIGLTGESQETIIGLARDLPSPHRWTSAVPGLPPSLEGVMECERTAAEVVEWSPLVIPDLLQTAQYAAEIIGDDDELTKAEVQARVELQLSRRPALAGEYTALIGEWALRQRVGGPAVLVEQLRRLVKPRDEAPITVQVVPIGTGWHPGLTGPLTLYNFADGTSVGYRAGQFAYEDVANYKVASARIRRAALSPADSVPFINGLIKKLEKNAARRSPSPKPD
ncbi:MAG TPA: helix-turn-helix transcriptional regulator [Pseudonocardiaceae bacterium]|nr:helix-turn-helix transcriptional regulator [Pseudonocardiaceae bacterium]